MAGTNDFLPFATAGGANVVSQSTYASMAALGTGYQTGIANSNQLNKTWRQSSIIASVIGQLIADVTGQNAVDDGTTATLLGNLLTAIQSASFTLDTSGSANSYTLAYSPAPIVPLTDGAVYSFRPAHSNTTASTLSVNGSPAHPIVDQSLSALVGGEILAGNTVTVVYAAPITSFILQNSAASASVTGNGYIRFGNGLIIQWGRVTNSSGSTVVNYPIAFPNAVFTTTLAPSVTGEIAYSFISSQTVAHFTANSRDSSSNPIASVQDWVAFGH